MFADDLGMIRDPQVPDSKVFTVGMGEGKPADRSVAKDKRGWAVLEGGDEKVRMAGLERANRVAMAKYKITSPLPWIESLETEEFAVEGISIKAKTFKAVFSVYCRCKNVDQLISIRRAKWFFECHEVSTEAKFYAHKDRCNTALHWAEFLVEPAKLGSMYYSELIALTSLPPAALPIKKYLAQTEKIFARYPKAWNLLPDEIQREHVACCQQIAVACPLLIASLGQVKQVRVPEYLNYKVLYQAVIGKGVYPPGATARTLAVKRFNNDSCLLLLAVETGHLPPGTTIKDMMSSQHVGPFKAPLYFAALHG